MNIFSTIAKLPKLYSIGGAVVIVAAVVGGLHVLYPAAPTADTPASISHVQLASVASLSSQTGPLPVTGTVASKSDATILAQTGGEVTSLNHALGDSVSAGAVIATFENSSQQAAVLQAQGAYDAANAALEKAQGTTATNSTITSAQAQTAAGNAANAARSTLASAFAALDDAVHTKADTLFNNPRSASPTLMSFTIPDSQLVVNINDERAGLEAQLQAAGALASAAAGGDVDTNIAQMSSSAQQSQAFLDDLIKALNEAVPNGTESASVIAAAQATLAAARTEVVNAVASLVSAKSAYDSAVAGAQTAANSSSSGTSSDIASAQANVKSALGALQAAQANLQKTIIRSPISGTIVSLPITQGDYVSAFSQVADVSNPSALEVQAYVTSDDAKSLQIGGNATINGSTIGRITFIGPALDPATNKIEIKIGIVGSQTALTDGDTVSIELERTETPGTAASSQANGQGIVIPIVAAKITPQGAVVFTVSASSTLIAAPIQLGTILGNQVAVVQGLTPEMDIVTDARGLSAGQSVVVDQ